MNSEKAQVLIIHGPVGSGKTTKAMELKQRVVSRGYQISGLLSLRVIQNDETIGYNVLNLKTGVSFNLVRLRSLADSDDWEKIGPWKYAFSKEGFKTANIILGLAAYGLSRKEVVFIDEYGHIELLGRGIYQGLMNMLSSIREGSKVVIVCRTDKLENLLNLLGKDIKVFVLSSSDTDFWEKVTDYFI